MRPLAIVSLALSLVLAACDDYPKDPNHTLERAKASGVLEVGLVVNPPWVARGGDGPQGSEVAQLRAFAAAHGMEPVWHYVSLREAEAGLKDGSLHVVAGGITKTHGEKLGLSATRPHSELMADGEKHALVMLVPAGENAFITALERQLAQQEAPR